ncbi:MAG: DUF1802 family protein [Verrucomicrobiota bacterium]
MESVGFKEWAIVCEALGRGEQTVIVRKGGIAEGRDGFSFRYREFFLFPTWFHEQADKVRKIDVDLPAPNADKIDIGYFARLESSHVIPSWPMAEALKPFHILQQNVVRERFEYDQAPGLHVAFVRIFRVRPTWTIVNEKKYGGCRSWVDLPELPGDLRYDPVLSDNEYTTRYDEFAKLIGSVDMSSP